MKLGTAVVRAVQPFRARCGACKVTQVLLPVFLATRRADEAEVIALALEAWIIHRWGHRRIAVMLGRPISTVRGWLRSFAQSALALTAWFRVLVLRDAGDAAGIWPAPSSNQRAAALNVLVSYARVFTERFALKEGMVPWHGAALVVVGPWIFRAPWWAGKGATPIGSDARAC